jgi:hypothetical protein
VLSRASTLAGAAATILAAFLPWVTLQGLTVTLDPGLVGAVRNECNNSHRPPRTGDRVRRIVHAERHIFDAPRDHRPTAG